MPGRYTRRRLLRTGAATATGLGAIGTVSATANATDDLAPERIPLREFDADELRTETVAAAAVPEQASGVRPGSQLFTHFPDGTTAGCSANFVWRDGGGAGGSTMAYENGDPPAVADVGPEDAGDGDLYIGAAGHCFLPSDVNAAENAQRDGESDDDVFDVSQLTVEICVDCTFGGLTGLSVVQGETVELGEVAYARQALPDGSQVGHDFGVVRIPAEAEELVDASMPQWGGPDGALDGAAPEGAPVNQYGAGVGNGEVFATQGSTGVSLGDGGTPESWYAAVRASPGDSGSPLVATDTEAQPPEGGAAAGILTHLTTLGTAGTTVGRCRSLPQEDGVDLDLEVVRADEL